MKMVMQLLDYENKLGQETRFVVHPDDTEDQLVEMCRQCVREMIKALAERRALAESSTARNNQQGKQFLQ